MTFFSLFFNTCDYEFFEVIRSGSVNCLPKSDLFISVFNTYKRKFVVRPTTFSTKTHMVLCPKLDGVRAIGLWDKTTLLTYSLQYGFKAFCVPDIWSPTIICQIEWFSETDKFVVTEIYACMYIDNVTDHVNWLRDNKHVKTGEGLYNGSNTTLQLQTSRRKLFIDVNPKDSIDVIQFLNVHYPLIFTRYIMMTSDLASTNHSALIRMVCKECTNYPTDGALLLNVTYDDEQDCWSVEYIKLKTAHTIELLFRYKTTDFVSMNGTVYNEMIDTRDMAENEKNKFVWQKNHCQQAGRDMVFEFIVIYNTRVFLRPKSIREDKIEPDNDCKINKYISK